MGIGKLQEELKKAKQACAAEALKTAQLEQLTWLNEELLKRLKATEKHHRSLLKYIKEIHKTLSKNENRTAIEEIWHRELDKYIRAMQR